MDRLHRDFSRFGQELRADLLRDGLEAAARYSHSQIPEKIVRFERRKRCLETIGKVVCWLLAICSIVLVLDCLCKKAGFKTPAVKAEEEQQERKEMVQRLAKIKGRNARL